MKKTILTLSAILATAVLAFADAEVGKSAPDFTVKDTDGKQHKLGDYKGKIVVLESYNLDCPFVVNHYNGAMQDLQSEVTGKGVVWLTVNSSYSDAGRLGKEVKQKKIKSSALIHDPKGTIGKTYGFKTTPHLIIIDKTGAVAYDGAIDDTPEPEANPRKAKNYVRAAVSDLIAGKPVATAKTKPYGCGNKYAN